MAQHVVAREQRVLLLQNEAHVVDRVARREDGPDSGALGSENLPVCDGILAAIRLVLVHSQCQLAVVGNKVCYATSVVSMPMSEQKV